MVDQSDSPLYGGNAAFLEELYQRYRERPEAVGAERRRYFDALARAAPSDVDHHALRAALVKAPQHRRPPAAAAGSDITVKQIAVLQLLNADRFRGPQQARLAPLGMQELAPIAELDPAFHALTEADIDTVCSTGSLAGQGQASLREILATLRAAYCGTVGAEYMHITDTAEKRWIQRHLEEEVHNRAPFSAEFRGQILDRVLAAEGLEQYLHTKYVGQKRFSLEGGESLIPLLDELIRRAGSRKVEEILMGMAHRGRLNVLVNVLGKAPKLLFMEFEGKLELNGSSGGDVKYHQGFSSDIETPGGPVHLALGFNPSHLEIIDPVVEGSVRARQDRRGDSGGAQVLPVLIHRDAAFAGQGVVMETFNMSQARGFKTHGTVHIVINNQIGFTTSNPLDARSTFYCTEVARMVQAPIFHVNGDDPDAVVRVTQLALDFRMQFRRDVVIDLVCYRRHGHTEADAMLKQYHAKLDEGVTVARNIIVDTDGKHARGWAPYVGGQWTEQVDTGAPLQRIRDLTARLLTLPEGFELHPQVAKIMEARRTMAAGTQPVDWGYAEILAYATLLSDGCPVRLSGQDSGRGTFFHRHAVLHNQKEAGSYTPLQHLFAGQPLFNVNDSLLSEAAVLGFEYGYAGADVPHAAAPGAAQLPQAADRDVAEKPAAPPHVGGEPRRAE